MLLGSLCLSLLVTVVVGKPRMEADVPTEDFYLTAARQLLTSSPLVDGHNDLPWQLYKRVCNKLSDVDLAADMRSKWRKSRTDINRMRKGHVGAQFWVVFVSCKHQYCAAVRRGLEQIDVIKRMIRRYPATFEMVTSAHGIMRSFGAGRIGSLIGLEGGHVIDSSLATLRMFYELGVRYMSLTHNCNTPWSENWKADRNMSSTHEGLTDFGKGVIREMNRLGMIADLAHVSKATMKDAITQSSAPVMFSHSSAWGLCHHDRNVRDDVLNMTAINGGIVMVNFHAPFINCHPSNQTTATLSQVADHIEYIRDVTGIDHVGIGSDFDGGITAPSGLEDVSKLPLLFAELMRRGWQTEELKKLAGLNLVRVFREVERIRDHLRNVQPSEDLLV